MSKALYPINSDFPISAFTWWPLVADKEIRAISLWGGIGSLQSDDEKLTLGYVRKEGRHGRTSQPNSAGGLSRHS